MKKYLLLISLIVLSAVGCASNPSNPNPNKPTLTQYIVFGQASLNEACSVGWVPAVACTIGQDTFTLALSISTGTDSDQVKLQKVKQLLIDTDMTLTPDNRLKPYLEWIIRILNVVT